MKRIINFLSDLLTILDKLIEITKKLTLLTKESDKLFIRIISVYGWIAILMILIKGM